MFCSKAIFAQAVYFLHSTMPSVTCLRLSNVSVICRVTYLQVPIQACFSSMSYSQAAQRRTWFTQYRTLNVAENLGRPKFLVRSVQFRRMTLHRLTIKMETRHSADGSFGSEFLAICIHCGVMAARSRKTLKFCEILFPFRKKTTFYGKIFKILFRKFLA